MPNQDEPIQHRLAFRLLASLWIATVAGQLFVGCSLSPSPETPAERSRISASTIVGANFGVPTGTPYSGATPVGALDVVFEGTSFLSEIDIGGHSDPTLEGETFIGFFVPARLRFRPHEKLTVELGAHLTRKFGDDAQERTEPLWRVAYESAPGVSVVGGTIFPTHAIHEALLDDIQKLRDNVEEGIQIRVNRDHWKQDLWLNWRVEEAADRREEFEVGSVTEFRSGPWRFHGQALLYHVGGQRNNIRGIDNDYTSLAGASFGFPIPARQGELRASVLALYNDLEANAGDHHGSGFEGRLQADLLVSDTTTVHPYVAFFVGDDLITTRGEPRYRIDDYNQVGCDAVIAAAGGLRVDLAGAMTFDDSTSDFTFQVLFSWGASVPLPSPRRDLARAARGTRAGQ